MLLLSRNVPSHRPGQRHFQRSSWHPDDFPDQDNGISNAEVPGMFPDSFPDKDSHISRAEDPDTSSDAFPASSVEPPGDFMTSEISTPVHQPLCYFDGIHSFSN